MMNVTPVWDMGITGKGVITALVDDGLDYTSDDLAANFYAAGSYDFNDHTDLPTPVLFDDHHGTRCAGQIAAVKNDVCGVGLAYDSLVAGVRILSGPISDIDEAAALNYDYQNTSIYSCSWGPPDDGRSMEGPGYLIKKAMVNGVQNGRGGKGSVFVFASGNGGRSGDQCNFDGYTNSIFSVTVAAVDYKGIHPDYSEACAANMIVSYSSGSGNHITTTDRGKNKCSYSHGGTSAAAPNAAGVFALALEARPDLSWRDIQHLCVRTAQKVNPDDSEWEMTASGRPFSYKYGYGSLNGYEFIKAAQVWQLAKPQTWIDLPAVQVANGTMDAFERTSGGEPIVPGGVASTMAITQEMLDEYNFEGLEHITVTVWITHSRRGDVEVELVSPNGITSMLAARRAGDNANSGYPGWTFMTVKHWDENPVGDWTLRVSDQSKESESGTFLGWTMSIWGSVKDTSKEIKPYVVPLSDPTLPLTPESSDESDDDTTSTITAPTADPTEVADETDKPSPSSVTVTQPTEPAEDISVPTNLHQLRAQRRHRRQTRAGAVVLFGVGAGIFFWRCAVARKRAHYASLPAGDDVAMSSIRVGSRGGQRTKELYDAFGEVSDDEDADESTTLRPQGRTPVVEDGFHSGFLDDDEPSTANSPPGSRYRDDPEKYQNDVEKKYR
ncbi:Protease KEX1 [Grifola frondosa]|uniref:Protease KEX1 n=1 Tax=Grifola frondosa TaxID=5627 RepID=A0A1C7LSD5_GRIFR|nr:Protease KEX1 [Grifola frondosa]